MAKLIPFRPIVPHTDFAGEVSTKSINTYGSQEIKLLQNNPKSYIHVVQPQKGTKPNSAERFMKVNKQFLTFLEKGILTQLPSTSFLVYQQVYKDKSFTGIIAGASVQDYEKGVIKKHEKTLSKREKIFTKYLKICGFNAEPVLLTYPSKNEINNIIAYTIKKKPLLTFNAIDEEAKHTLWEINDTNTINCLIACFEQIPALYIADGHHRCASSYLLSKEIKAETILSFFVSDEEIEIYDFNRVVKDLNGLSTSDFINKLTAYFEIKKELVPLTKPAEKHHFSMYIENQFYTLKLKHPLIKKTSPIEQLDAQILTNLILAPILNITDLTNNKRIDFISGKNGLDSLKKQVDSGKFKAGFCLYPVTYQELVAIADNNLIMPPKSTWIEPKLRTGLTIYKFDDE